MEANQRQAEANWQTIAEQAEANRQAIAAILASLPPAPVPVPVSSSSSTRVSQIKPPRWLDEDTLRQNILINLKRL